MENIIHVDLAIRHYNETKPANAKRMDRVQLIKAIWGEGSERTHYHTLNQWATGQVCRLHVSDFKRFLEVTGVDANFALGIKKMEGIV
jgi:hypothetical protein